MQVRTAYAIVLVGHKKCRISKYISVPFQAHQVLKK